MRNVWGVGARGKEGCSLKTEIGKKLTVPGVSMEVASSIGAVIEIVVTSSLLVLLLVVLRALNFNSSF